MNQIKVLLCDRQPLIRSGLHANLESLSDIEVLGEAGAAEVVTLARRMRPDVVLTEIDLPVEQGIKNLRMLAQPLDGRPLAVLVLTHLQAREDVFAIIRAGARGIVLKDGTLGELHAGIRAVAEGNGVIAAPIVPSILNWVATYLPDQAAKKNLLDKLTPRERQILSHVVRGESNVKIARRLGLSQATVRSHTYHVLAKFGLEDRAQAVAFFYRMGLIPHLADG